MPIKSSSLDWEEKYHELGRIFKQNILPVKAYIEKWDFIKLNYSWWYPWSIDFMGSSTESNAEDAIGVDSFITGMNVSTQGQVRLNKDAELRNFIHRSPLPCVPMGWFLNLSIFSIILRGSDEQQFFLKVMRMEWDHTSKEVSTVPGSQSGLSLEKTPWEPVRPTWVELKSMC